MNNKKLLPITLLTTFFLAACTNTGGSGSKPIVLPEEHEDGHHTFTIDNLTELQSGWPAAAEGKAGLQKTFDISVFTDSVEGNPDLEMNNKNLELISSDPKVLSVSGFTATSGVVGEATIAVRYYETVQHFKFTVSETLPEPGVKTGLSITQILADCPDHDKDLIYEATGVVKGWHSKDSWNQYGEFDLADPADPASFLYFYSSWVNTTAEPAKFNWDGSTGQYSYEYKARNVLTADLTKDLKIGDTVTINIIYAKQYSNFYGIFKSVTPGAVVECTSVELNKTSLTLTEGGSETLTATILPENCNQTASWESSDPDVATVSNGTVVAKKAGDATITVTVGSKSATCSVHVDTDVSTDIALTIATLGAKESAYSDSEAAVDVKGVSWNYTELGNYGDGLQWRTKNSKSTSIWNSSATTSSIASITFTWNKKKTIPSDADKIVRYQECINVEFANNADFTSAQTMKVTFTDSMDPVTLTAPAGMTFVRMTHTNKGASLYLDDVTLKF